MDNDTVGMGEQGQAERQKFENELKRILKASDDSGVILRVIGSLAFQLHCPKFGYLQQAMGRAYTDIDFAAYGKQTRAIQELMSRLGYVDNQEVFIVSGGTRSIFDRAEIGLHIMPADARELYRRAVHEQHGHGLVLRCQGHVLRRRHAGEVQAAGT